MKKLLLFIFGTMLAFAANGQSKLPSCQGSDATKWSNCFGTYTWAGGEKYAGEWKDGKRRGEGINTLANGRVQEGFWIDDKFVKPEKINLPSQQADPPLNENRPRLEAVQNTQSNWPPCPKVDYSKNAHLGVDGRTGKWHNCFGRYRAELNDTYKGDVLEGEWRNGFLNGQVTYTFPSGEKYAGEWKDGKYNGQGTYIFPSGEKYAGEYKDNKRNGQGTYIFATGSKYVGEWKDDKYHGQGTYIFASGSKYIGEYKDDKKHGQGTFTAANGDKYVGEWKDDKSHGRGVQTYADGRPSQEGIWAEDKFVRAEKINLPQQQTDLALNEDRRRLEAERRSQQSAQETQGNLPPCPPSNEVSWHMCFGTFTLKNGYKYVGEWKDDKYHGQGTYYSLADNQFKGDKYVGEYKDNKRNGQGTYIFATGSKYVGEWKDDKYHGQGTFTWADGDKYVGEYKDDKKHGQGTFTFADGRIREGIWADDKFVRAEKIVTPSELAEQKQKLDPGRRGQFDRIPVPVPVGAKRKNRNTEFARMKCIDFGFKAGTPAYADCVKEYLKSSGNTLPNTKE